MQLTELGNTGLQASVAGLGAGGFSRLGLGTGSTNAQAADVVRAALDSGVNFIDTAAVYGTEEAVGQAIRGRRDEVIVSTKSLITRDGEPMPIADIVASLDNSLKTLNVDSVDVFHLHAVKPENYAFALNEVWPALEREQAKGKFRFVGITETSPNDLDHRMLIDALNDPDAPWRVMMLAHNLMHQSAERDLYPHTLRRGIGTLVMFAVRRIFANPEMLSEEIVRRVANGELSADDVDVKDPIGFLLDTSGASSLTEAAYRFCRHEPGAEVVLFGTGKIEHVKANVDALNAPALPDADVARAKSLFGALVGVGIELPTKMKD